ncbi:MAG: DUF1659 domain-containing protein [Bacillota bacterium]|uniref:DUF1659 domain-containing protein n=1 Tax=Thermanaerosceptrum fracticalcis TaxID=1712410 RepID=A0A7G6DZ41_THEFR|nr:DUF1659 domain-containing protein [Thermanaerosceptrum fracticalcis]QNB45095.1 DUF1659 domain-containing protein [Thermanaerosceptrum fracticalcis]
MPVLSTLKDSSLKLIMQTGVDEKGNPVFKTRSYGNIKPSASDQDIYTLAQQLAGLQVHTLDQVSRMNNFELTEI